MRRFLLLRTHHIRPVRCTGSWSFWWPVWEK